MKYCENTESTNDRRPSNKEAIETCYCLEVTVYCANKKGKGCPVTFQVYTEVRYKCR